MLKIFYWHRVLLSFPYNNMEITVDYILVEGKGFHQIVEDFGQFQPRPRQACAQQWEDNGIALGSLVAELYQPLY